MLRYFNIVGNGDSVFGTVSGENRQKDNPPIRLYLWMIKLMMDEYLYIIEEKNTTKVVSFFIDEIVELLLYISLFLQNFSGII